MAEHRLAGEAFVGTVVSAIPNRRVGSGRSLVLRPLITVLTQDPVRLVPGEATVTDRARPRQKAEIVDVVEMSDGVHITLELTVGMGRGRTAPVGSVPEVDEQVCFSTLTDSFPQRGSFPTRTDTPWTHGGPPPSQTAPVADDAQEEWS